MRSRAGLFEEPAPTGPPADAAEERRAWQEQGFLRLGRVADAATVARLRAEEERFRLGFGYGAAANRNLRVNIQLCHRSEPIRRFCTAGPHLAAVVRLLGPNVCLTHQQFVTKLPDAEGEHSDIPWHQDAGYGPLEPASDVTVWLPLVDSDERNGCLRVVPGSHRLGLLDHGPAALNPLLREAHSDQRGIALPLAAGEAVAFSGLLLHGSGPNRSSAPRPAFYARYCDPHAVMLDRDRLPVLEAPHAWMVAGEA
jgi:ectoine hydroxylase-related dioxygenase (phytanoyl-CoA dioxygenase family)